LEPLEKDALLTLAKDPGKTNLDAAITNAKQNVNNGLT
jgi:hypothetical protein